MKYLVIIEQGENSFGAYIPDLPGCVAAGESKEEVMRLIQEAVKFHLEGVQKQGIPIPEPRSHAEVVGAGI